MNNSTPFGAALLALAAITTSCTTFASRSARGDKVYLVGVAGGG